MSRTKTLGMLAVLGVGTYLVASSIYTVSEVEQVIITQFGKPQGGPVQSATTAPYNSTIAKNTTLVLSTDSDLFKFLKGVNPNSRH